jgi:hypothetical protein
VFSGVTANFDAVDRRRTLVAVELLSRNGSRVDVRVAIVFATRAISHGQARSDAEACRAPHAG